MIANWDDWVSDLFIDSCFTFSDTLLDHAFDFRSFEIERIVSVWQLRRRLNDVTPVDGRVEVLAFNEISSGFKVASNVGSDETNLDGVHVQGEVFVFQMLVGDEDNIDGDL